MNAPAQGSLAVSVPTVSLGVRANLQQILLLVLLNAFVGATIGIERSILVPLGTSSTFGLSRATAVTSFIVAFGVTKALTNLTAGRLADALGRRRVLLLGWLLGIPVPLLILWAPSWGWVVAANVFLGINQGLCWTLTLFMKLDLGGPRRRGFAAGINETIGYGAVALTALAGTEIAHVYGLRPYPLYFALAVTFAGAALAYFLVRDTFLHVEHEHRGAGGPARPPFKSIFARVTLLEPALVACVQAGMVRNLADGMAWGLLMLLFSRTLGDRGAGTLQWMMIGAFALGQIAFGSWSDRVRRKPFIVAGMLLMSVALVAVGTTVGFVSWAPAVLLLGLGGSMMYPTVIAALSDQMDPLWRSSGLGVYRFWRDMGYAIGALSSGLVADAVGMRAAILAVAALCAVSGVAAALLLPPEGGRGDST